MKLDFAYGMLIILIGWMHGRIIGLNSGLRALKWGRLFFEPGRFTKPKHILRRAKLVTSYHVVLVLLPMLVTVPFVTFLIVQGAMLGHLYYLVFFFFGFGMPHFKPRNMVFMSFRNFIEWMTKIAARKVAEHCPEEVSTRYLGELFYTEDSYLEEASRAGLAVLGPEKAVKVLELLQKQKSQVVRSRAKIALMTFTDPEFGRKTISSARHSLAIEDLKRWRGALTTHLIGRNAIRANVFESAVTIDDWVWDQSEFNRSFPHIFCKECRARGEEVQFEHWKWVRCRVCKEATHLVTQVEVVVGQIGGDAAWTVDGNRLLVSVWDADAKKPNAADLDVLEFVSGKPLDFDWAAASVAEAMINGSKQVSPAFQVLKTGNVALSANSEAILKRLGAK